MSRADQTSISVMLMLLAAVWLALVVYLTQPSPPPPPAATPVVVTVTPYEFGTPQPVVTMSPPVPHHTASPVRFDHLPRAVVTLEPTPTTLPALILADPTETPEPTVTPTLKPAVQKGELWSS